MLSKERRAHRKVRRADKRRQKPRKDPLVRERLAKLDEEFVSVQQATVGPRALRKPQRTLQPVSGEEVQQSIKELGSLLRLC